MVLPIYICDDNSENIEEITTIILDLYHDTEIRGQEFQLEIQDASDFKTSIALLSDPVNLVRGGIVLLDLAFNPVNHRDMHLFSFNMIRELVEKNQGEPLPYTFILITAFNELSESVLLDYKDAFKRNEMPDIIYRRNTSGKTIKEQIKSSFDRFIESHHDTGNSRWRKYDQERNEWLDKYRMVISTKKGQVKPNWSLSEILLIEISDELKNGSFWIYPVSNPLEPIEAYSIRFPNLNNMNLEEGIYQMFKPSKSESPVYLNLLSQIEQAPLPFLVVHQSIMMNCIYFEGHYPVIPDRFQKESKRIIDTWNSRHDMKQPNDRGGYVNLSVADFNYYVPVSLGADKTRGYDGNSNVENLLSMNIKKWKHWLKSLRIV